MPKALSLSALVIALGLFNGLVGCTDNSGNGNYTGVGGSVGGAGGTDGGAAGEDGSSDGAAGADGGGDAGVDGAIDGADVGNGADAPGTEGGADADVEAGAFQAVAPCNSEATYVAGTVVSFDNVEAKYTPACLKISRGTSVEFRANAATFADHPLRPSVKRGDMPNPIAATSTGTTASFTFPNPGRFAFFCDVHGMADVGMGMMMAGVIWVQ